MPTACTLRKQYQHLEKSLFLQEVSGSAGFFLFKGILSFHQRGIFECFSVKEAEK